MKSFIHFGCWNKGFCDIDNVNNGMSAVMKKLIQSEKKPDFYIIAGDNYYPKKFKEIPPKYTVFNEKNFNSGMECALKLTNNRQIPCLHAYGKSRHAT